MAKVRDCWGDLCVDKGARFNDNVFSQFFEYSMFCFRFGNLLVRLLVLEFRNIFSALVFSSISYLCDRWITRKHTAPLLYMFSVFANPSFCPTFKKKSQRVAREPGLLKRSPQQRAPGSPWPVPRLLSPTTVPEETKEIPHRSS